MTSAAIVWRILDDPGHEACRLESDASGWQITGAAVFSYEQQPCHLSYTIHCDAAWQTQSVAVHGWVGSRTVAIEISADAERRWQLNGRACQAVEGCFDIDLNFSPSTNMLPLRRLSPAIGQEIEVRAAWLRFPSFELEPLPQSYRRLDDANYHYESNGGSFVTTITFHESGLVAHYPNGWQVEAAL